jgi:hypothetical protein
VIDSKFRTKHFEALAIPLLAPVMGTALWLIPSMNFCFPLATFKGSVAALSYTPGYSATVKTFASDSEVSIVLLLEMASPIFCFSVFP